VTIELPEEASAALNPASLSVLFVEFFKVSLLGFGGGIALAHRAAVERRRWLSEAAPRHAARRAR
jgi:chromate transport protein ChrA